MPDDPCVTSVESQIDAKAINAIEAWDAVSKKVYWDRDVALDKWREMVHAGHPSYLPDAIGTIDVTEFVHFYGAKRFVQDWPTLRPSLPGAVAQSAGAEKRGWANAAELISIRELRNLIAHEYATEKMLEIYASVAAMSPALLTAVPKAIAYANTLIQRYSK